MNRSSIFPERIEITEERGIRRGIRENGENRLSTDDLTIEANISSNQCTMVNGSIISPERIEIAEERGIWGMGEKGK